MSCIANVWIWSPPSNYTLCSSCNIEIAHLLSECTRTVVPRTRLLTELNNINGEITKQLSVLDPFCVYLMFLGARLCPFTTAQNLHKAFLKQVFNYVCKCLHIFIRQSTMSKTVKQHLSTASICSCIILPTCKTYHDTCIYVQLYIMYSVCVRTLFFYHYIVCCIC